MSDEIRELLPLLIPIIILQYTLAIVAIINILKNNKFKIGNKYIWILVVFILQIIGPVLYFIIGRDDE